MPDLPKHPVNNPQVLLDRIKKAFPELKWEKYTYINSGWDHEVLILDNQLVFRFPNDDEYSRLLVSEMAVLKRLKPLVSVAVPGYSFVSADNSFAGYTLVPGQLLSRALFDSLEVDDRTTLAKQLAAFLSTMHTLIQTGRDFSSVSLSDNKEYHQEMKQQAFQQLRPILTPSDYKIVEGILAAADDLFGQKLPSVLLHGDIIADHLLWEASTKTLGIIDFSDMNRGDPAFDFAELYEYGADYILEIYKYYTGPKDETFLPRAWVYQQWMAVFMMTNYFVYHKTSFAEARQTFDRVKIQLNQS